MRDSPNSTGAREGNLLTAREFELLALVAGGLTTADIAKQLDITSATIKVHLTSVYKKTATRNRVQASLYYLDNLRPNPAMPIEVLPGAAIDAADENAPTGHPPHHAPRPPRRLSRRELQVLELVGAGETNEAIGRELGLTGRTIKTYLTSIYKKIGAQNRVQAARYYLRHYGTADAAQLTTLDDDIADVRARLHELAPVVEKAQRLQHALEELQAARSRFKS